MGHRFPGLQHLPGQIADSARAEHVHSGSLDPRTRPSTEPLVGAAQMNDTPQQFVLVAVQRGDRPYRQSRTFLW